jgi:hypothetical protein
MLSAEHFSRRDLQDLRLWKKKNFYDNEKTCEILLMLCYSEHTEKIVPLPNLVLVRPLESQPYPIDVHV